MRHHYLLYEIDSTGGRYFCFLAAGYVREFNYSATFVYRDLHLQSMTPHMSHNVNSRPRVFLAWVHYIPLLLQRSIMEVIVNKSLWKLLSF